VLSDYGGSMTEVKNEEFVNEVKKLKIMHKSDGKCTFKCDIYNNR